MIWKVEIDRDAQRITRELDKQSVKQIMCVCGELVGKTGDVGGGLGGV